MEEDVQEEQVTLIQDSQNEVSTHLRPSVYSEAVAECENLRVDNDSPKHLIRVVNWIYIIF